MALKIKTGCPMMSLKLMQHICCSAYLSYPPVTGQRQTLNIGRSKHFSLQLDHFVAGGIRTRFGVSSNPMFPWNAFNSCPLNLLPIRRRQVEMIIVKLFIQRRNNVTRVWVEPRSRDQSRRKSDAFTHSATLPTK